MSFSSIYVYIYIHTPLSHGGEKVGCNSKQRSVALLKLAKIKEDIPGVRIKYSDKSNFLCVSASFVFDISRCSLAARNVRCWHVVAVGQLLWRYLVAVSWNSQCDPPTVSLYAIDSHDGRVCLRLWVNLGRDWLSAPLGMWVKCVGKRALLYCDCVSARELTVGSSGDCCRYPECVNEWQDGRARCKPLSPPVLQHMSYPVVNTTTS